MSRCLMLQTLRCHEEPQYRVRRVSQNGSLCAKIKGWGGAAWAQFKFCLFFSWLLLSKSRPRIVTVFFPLRFPKTTSIKMSASMSISPQQRTSMTSSLVMFHPPSIRLLLLGHKPFERKLCDTFRFTNLLSVFPFDHLAAEKKSATAFLIIVVSSHSNWVIDHHRTFLGIWYKPEGTKYQLWAYVPHTRAALPYTFKVRGSNPTSALSVWSLHFPHVSYAAGDSDKDE